MLPNNFKETSQQDYTPLIIGIISSVSVIFLIWLIYFAPNNTTSFDYSILSYVNASLNGLSTLFLLLGKYFINNKNISAHKRSMYLAFTTSSLFLISYIIYHTFHGDTKFMATEVVIRAIYFLILITHILISIPTLPMVLYTFSLALKKDFDKHKIWAKRTFYPWLYVSVTGVIIVVMLHFFN